MPVEKTGAVSCLTGTELPEVLTTSSHFVGECKGQQGNPLAASLLPPCPPPGQGVHNWTLKAAHACRCNGLTPEQAVEAIRGEITRPPRPREIEDAVTKAYNSTLIGKFTPTINATYDPAALERVAAKRPDFSEEDLAERSPIPIDRVTPATYLTHLSKPGERVVICTDMRSTVDLIWDYSLPAEQIDPHELNDVIRPPAGLGTWFLCNPVTGEITSVSRLATDRNPQGLTYRAEECLTSYRYIVVESDSAPTDLWLRVLVQLPLPIASIVTSGGRSLHALVRVDATSADDWKVTKTKIAPALVTLGADLSAMSAVRLTRLPCCYRAQKGMWQRLLYLNPKPTCLPICQMPVLRPSRKEVAA